MCQNRLNYHPALVLQEEKECLFECMCVSMHGWNGTEWNSNLSVCVCVCVCDRCWLKAWVYTWGTCVTARRWRSLCASQTGVCPTTCSRLCAPVQRLGSTRPRISSSTIWTSSRPWGWGHTHRHTHTHTHTHAYRESQQQWLAHTYRTPPFHRS